MNERKNYVITPRFITWWKTEFEVACPYQVGAVVTLKSTLPDFYMFDSFSLYEKEMLLLDRGSSSDLEGLAIYIDNMVELE